MHASLWGEGANNAGSAAERNDGKTLLLGDAQTRGDLVVCRGTNDSVRGILVVLSTSQEVGR